jgi:hypothetical protein
MQDIPRSESVLLSQEYKADYTPWCVGIINQPMVADDMTRILPNEDPIHKV